MIHTQSFSWHEIFAGLILRRCTRFGIVDYKKNDCHNFHGTTRLMALVVVAAAADTSFDLHSTFIKIHPLQHHGIFKQQEQM